MIAIIFEVVPKVEHKQKYLDIAAELMPILEKIDGFISVERFQSLSDTNKLLSLSFFRDEEAVHEWRKTLKHQNAQLLGRERVFENYRLRVAGVIRDYGMYQRNEAPKDE